MTVNPYESVPADELRGRVRAISAQITKLKQERRAIQAELEQRQKRIVTQVSPGARRLQPSSIESGEVFGKV